jgi:hypothetical protein
MNSFQEDDPNNFNPNSYPKEEMVSLSPIFTQYIYSYRNQTLIILKITIIAK